MIRFSRLSGRISNFLSGIDRISKLGLQVFGRNLNSASGPCRIHGICSSTKVGYLSDLIDFSAIPTYNFLCKGYAALKQKQKAWAVDNGLRVHERGTKVDAVSFHFNAYHLDSPFLNYIFQSIYNFFLNHILRL